MANRRMSQFRYAFEMKLVDVFLKVSVGASGAPTLLRGKGVSSIVKGGAAGQYVITLGTPQSLTDPARADTYQLLLDADVIFVNAGGAQVAPIMSVIADNSALGAITVQFNSAAGSGNNVYPASGETMLIKLTLSNSGI